VVELLGRFRGNSANRHGVFRLRRLPAPFGLKITTFDVGIAEAKRVHTAGESHLRAGLLSANSHFTVLIHYGWCARDRAAREERSGEEGGGGGGACVP